MLVLKDGAVLAAGSRPEVLTEDVLSEAFGLRVKLTPENGRYRMTIPAVK